MKLRTLYCNRTVLRKDITRFAPVWGLYTVLMLMYLTLRWEATDTAAEFAGEANSIMNHMGIVNFLYAGICTIVLFGDLFSPKHCYALHSLPLRREEWFLTHCTSGFLFCLIPNTLGALITCLLIPPYWYLAVIWLALMLLQFLFFFGVGAFSVMCAGTRLGAATVYVAINFFGELLQWFYAEFYYPHLYGFPTRNPIIKSPISSMSGYYPFANFRYENDIFVFDGLALESWRFLLIAAAIGLTLLVVSSLLYRKRDLEHAGRFIILRPVRFLFLIINALFIGTVMRNVADSVARNLQDLFLVLGIAIGFFTVRMLMERKVNVFRVKNFLAFGGILVAFVASVGLTILDPLGLTQYVPNSENVASVQFSFSYNGNLAQGTITDPADIEMITQIHGDLIETNATDRNVQINLTYQLCSGMTVSRVYRTNSISDEVITLKKYIWSWEHLLGTKDTDALLENAYLLHFESDLISFPSLTVATSRSDLDQFGNVNHVKYLTESLAKEDEDPTGLNVELVRSLIEAIKADCDTGKMVQFNTDPNGYHRHPSGYLSLQYFDGSEEKTLKLNIYSDCIYTLQYLDRIYEQSKKPG